MARDVVQEASSCTFRVRFYAEDHGEVTPDTVQWRLRDVTNCRVLQDWTSITAAASIDIAIDASLNEIYNSRSCGDQVHVLSVQANAGQTNQFSDETRYVVRNLKGFS